MRDKEIQALLAKAPRPEIDGERKRRQLAYLREEYQLRLRPLHRKTRLQRWQDTVSYLSPATWLVQGLLLLVAADCIRGDRLRVTVALGLLSPLLGLVAVCELYRSYQHRMWEIETCCRYSLAQLMGMKLMVMGAMDLVLLLLLGAAGGRVGMGLNGICLMLLIPFLLSNAGYLWILGRFHGSLGAGLLFVTGAAFAWLCLVMPRDLPLGRGLGEGAGSFEILGATLASLLLLFWSARSFLKNCGREERRRWNFS